MARKSMPPWQQKNPHPGAPLGLARALKSVPGVFDAMVHEVQRLVTPKSLGESYREFCELPVEQQKIESYMEVEVDLQLRPYPDSSDWNWALTMDDLTVFRRVGLVMEDSVPAGIGWSIRQENELMKTDNRLPSFRDLMAKVPSIKEALMELMEHLDVWTLRSMEVVTERDGSFKSKWDPTLAPREAKPARVENWTVLLLEFVIPSGGVEKFTTLARSASKMTSKLGVEGSLTHNLEETVRRVTGENDEYRWAAAAYREMAVELLRWREGPKNEDWAGVKEVKDKLATEDMKNVGAVFAARFRKMEMAVHEKRPDVAADLMRELDDDE